MEDGFNIVVHENVFSSPEDIFQRLENEIIYLPPEQCQLRIRNKMCAIPRKIVAFGDAGLEYTFSGLTLNTQPWTPLLNEIKETVERLSGVDFNFVLINRYENGNDCIGQHRDDEADLDENYPISSLSLGETRTMIFKRPNFDDRRKELKANSLLIMNPPTNQVWTHGIPREKKRTGVRVNLTFRKMKTGTPDKRKLSKDVPSGINKKIKKDKSNMIGAGSKNEPQVSKNASNANFDEAVILKEKRRRVNKKYLSEEIAYEARIDVERLPVDQRNRLTTDSFALVQRLFSAILSSATAGLEEQDLIRFCLLCDKLDKPVSTGLTRVDEMTVEKLMTNMAKVLQSKDEIRLDKNFCMDVVTVKRPVGTN